MWKCLLRAILVQRGNCYLHHSINVCCWKILVWPPSISAAFPRIRVRESRWNRCLVATLLSLSWTQHPGLFSAQLLLPLWSAYKCSDYILGETGTPVCHLAYNTTSIFSISLSKHAIPDQFGTLPDQVPNSGPFSHTEGPSKTKIGTQINNGGWE